MERSRRNISKATIVRHVVYVPPLFWGQSAEKLIPGYVLSYHSYHSHRPCYNDEQYLAR